MPASPQINCNYKLGNYFNGRKELIRTVNYRQEKANEVTTAFLSSQRL